MKAQVIFLLILILCLVFLVQISKADICNETDIDFEVWIKSDCEHGIFEIYNEKFIDKIEDLPLNGVLNPEQVWQPSNWQDECKRDKNPFFVFGWVDILGYKDAIMMNGTFFVNKSIQDAVIIDYKTYSCVLGLAVFKLPLENKIEVYQQGDQVIAKLTSTQVMYSIYDGHKSYYNLTRIFYDSEPAPKQIQKLPDLKINATIFNNSFYENVGIHIVNSSGYFQYTIKYKDNIATYRIKKASVEQTEKGIYFANVTPFEFLEVEGKNISRFYGNMILVHGNINDVEITGSNLFESKRFSSKIMIDRKKFRPEKELEKPVNWVVVGIFISILAGINFFLSRWRP